MRATLSATFAGTGRLIHADENFGRLQTWAECPGPEALGSATFFAEVQQSIEQARPVADPVVRVLRGRLPPLSSTTPTSDEMGPPPLPAAATAGRYNAGGQAVLYCATSEEGVRRELRDRGNELWGQQFAIPTSHVRIADFRVSAHPERHLLNNLFWFTELAGADGYPAQVFSQYVAGMVATRFQAMLVPGVRGSVGERYENLIVFEPVTRWRDWLEPTKPYRL